jgi:hypothetical protein
LIGEVIPRNDKYSFKIKIFSRSSNILVGIVDRLVAKNLVLSSFQNLSAIHYHCFNGQVYPTSLQKNGVTISNEECIEIEVELSIGKIKFKTPNETKVTI